VTEPRPPAAGRATAVAPANIAFVKYWGASDLQHAIPVNPSISMTLSRCVSRTTVDFDPMAGEDAGVDVGVDEVWLRATEPGAERVGEETGNDEPTAGWDDDGDADDRLVDPGPSFRRRVLAHLAAIRRWRGLAPGVGRFRVVTGNSFPAAAGLASSASGFAALTVATLAALGRDPLGGDPDRGELSSLARRSGSGSAARSVLGGYVEWPAPGSAPDGAGDGDPRAAQLAPAAHWDLRDVIAVVETGAKEVSSLDGHRRALTSPHFERRQAELPRRLDEVRRALAERDLERLGPVLEEEAVELHLVAMSSRPPIFYWQPGTLEVLATVRALRRGGLGAWATMDAGANVHVICAAGDEPAVAGRLGELPAVRAVLRDRAGDGPTLHAEHLF
jgi:diphosphomevalonate decarboxylase